MPTIVIGDIHGRADLLQALLDKILAVHGPKVDLYHTGDLIDRGPQSKTVIQLCIDHNIKGILGNHELWMHQFFTTGHFDDFALHNMMQADKTLDSYGISSRSPGEIERQLKTAIPKAHRDYILSLPVWLNLKVGGRTFFLVHSAVKTDTYQGALHDMGTYGPPPTDEEVMASIGKNSPANILWTSNSFKNQAFHLFKSGAVQVFGHSPTPLGEPLVTPRWIAVDCGCGTRRSTLGCVVLETGKGITVNGLEIKGVKSGGHTDFHL